MVGSTKFYLHGDGEYHQNPSSLPRPNTPELQERKAFGKDGLRVRRSKGEKKDAGNNRKFLGATVEAVFYISDKRNRDLDGMMTTILDCLVNSGALPDDNWRDVRREIASGVQCQLGEERVEVTITKT